MSDRYAAHLSDVFKAARIKRGLTQSQLAARMQRPRTWISKAENGLTGDVQMSTLTRFADALETTPSALVRSAELRAEKARVA